MNSTVLRDAAKLDSLNHACMFKIEFSVRAREREWVRKRGSESLQVAELLNYLAMENHVSTVRGAGLNVSISARITSLCVCVCIKVCVCVCLCLQNVWVYGCTLSIPVALISHFSLLPSRWELSSPLHLLYYAV